jgi:SOS-response transcriptional repressor LexA
MVSTKLRVRELLRERRWTTKVLAEKTGMSESYLTHIKNGTRRWNEDALRKLAGAFEMEPTDLFMHRRIARSGEAETPTPVVEADTGAANVKVRIVPVTGEIPAHPTEYNNQVAQFASGYKGVYVPVFGSEDPNVFCYAVEDNSMAPHFGKGDMLIISPEVWTRSGDVVAVEYGESESPTKAIMQVNYMDEFVVLESVNHKKSPIALVRGKDMFRIIGKVLYRYQRMV